MIETVKETRSTNGDLGARVAQGAYVAEGHWLIADRQTAGRGRLGRDWIDGAGNFMGSTVVHLRRDDPPADTLALVAGLAAHGVIASRLAAVALKWPNDLLIEGAKLAGILLERIGDAVIVGIGVNLAQAPKVADRPTAALAELGVDLTRDCFAAELGGRFAEELNRWRSYGLDPILRRWEAAGHPRGTLLAIDQSGGTTLRGTFAGLTEAGALRLRLADGSAHVIHAGEVRIA